MASDTNWWLTVRPSTPPLVTTGPQHLQQHKSVPKLHHMRQKNKVHVCTFSQENFIFCSTNDIRTKEHIQTKNDLRVADVTSGLHATTKLQRQSFTHISLCMRSSQDVPATTDQLVVLRQLQTRQPPRAPRQRDEQITYEARVIEKVALPSSCCPPWGKICCQWKPSHPLSVSFTIPATRTVGGA